MCYILGFYKQLLGKIGSLLIIKKIGIKILKDDTCWTLENLGNLGSLKNLVFNNILCASYPWTYRVGTGTILISCTYLIRRGNLFSSFFISEKFRK